MHRKTLSLWEGVAATGLLWGEEQKHCCPVQDTPWAFPLSGNAAGAVVVLDQEPLSADAQRLLCWDNRFKYSAKQERLPLEF